MHIIIWQYFKIISNIVQCTHVNSNYNTPLVVGPSVMENRSGFLCSVRILCIVDTCLFSCCYAARIWNVLRCRPQMTCYESGGLLNLTHSPPAMLFSALFWHQLKTFLFCRSFHMHIIISQYFTIISNIVQCTHVNSNYNMPPNTVSNTLQSCICLKVSKARQIQSWPNVVKLHKIPHR